MAVEEVNLQHGQGGRLRGKRRRSATDMGVEKAAPGRPTDQVALLRKRGLRKAPHKAENALSRILPCKSLARPTQRNDQAPLLSAASLWGQQRGERKSARRDANGGSRRSINNAGYGWYLPECPEHRSAHQSPAALEQRIMEQCQGCRCCFQSSPLKRIVCHIT